MSEPCCVPYCRNEAVEERVMCQGCLKEEDTWIWDVGVSADGKSRVVDL